MLIKTGQSQNHGFRVTERENMSFTFGWSQAFRYIIQYSWHGFKLSTIKKIEILPRNLTNCNNNKKYTL